MAALTQRIRGHTLDGDFRLNGHPVSRTEMGRVSGFVPQNDTTMGILTVLEHLHFMAELKLEGNGHNREKAVQTALARLGLQHLSTRRIRLLSGGERKKVALAEVLINRPLFVFCDEPTTGLDSFNACTVMESLKKLTAEKWNNADATGKGRQ